MKYHGTNTKDPRNLFRSAVIYLIVISISGIEGLVLPAFTAASDSAPPVLHHHVPNSVTQGENFVIRVEANDDSDIATVDLWYRASGKSAYTKMKMTPTPDGAYEGRFPVTGDYREGLEYYIKASDRHGREGGDGTAALPYFVAVREMPVLTGLSSGDARKREKKPWWKSPWLWVSLSVIAGGVIAASAHRGGNDSQGSGTVVVQ
jgi:hypothetical protein